MFELMQPTKAKLINLFVLSQKNRQPDDNPGAKLLIEMQLPNDALSGLDGHIKGMLWERRGKTAPPAQAELNGVEPVSDMPNLSSLGLHVGTLQWGVESTGYGVEILQGIQTKRSNIGIDDCLLSKWRITPKEGGTAIVRVAVESQNVTEQQFGRLAKLKSREFEVLMRPPEVDQRDLDAEEKAARESKDKGTPAPSKPAAAPAKKVAKAKRAPKADKGPKQ